jgi:uncharacterized damage-inducible protein DinB
MSIVSRGSVFRVFDPANSELGEGDLKVHYQELIDRYLAGPDLVHSAVQRMNEEQLNAKPVAGKWSTRQVVCHLADFEPIYADRMKRVIAEQWPTFFGGDPDTFAAHLGYDHRSVEAEVSFLTATRQHVAAILNELKATDFQRVGNHAEAGPMTLEDLLRDVANHVPHHVGFINEKRQLLGI